MPQACSCAASRPAIGRWLSVDPKREFASGYLGMGNNPTITKKETYLYGASRLGNIQNAKTYYELTDHIGSVRAMVSEGTTGIEINSTVDYYPWGSPMPGKEFYGSLTARNGFQGVFSEKDAETGWNSFELRMYDAKIGRWMGPDPYREFYSAYIGMGNNPVSNVDPDGGQVDPPTKNAADFKGQHSLGSGASGRNEIWKSDGKNWVRLTGRDARAGWTSFQRPKNSSFSDALDKLQVGIDLVGLVPAFGEIADGANAIIYTARGDYTNAGFSAGSMIPFYGWISTGGKYVNKGVNAAEAANTTVKILNQFNSAESLIQGAGKLTKVKAGMQGFVKGDGPSIYNAITNGGTKQANGTILMPDGTTIFNHSSTKTGDYTIDINKAGQIYKIRIGQ